MVLACSDALQEAPFAGGRLEGFGLVWAFRAAAAFVP